MGVWLANGPAGRRFIGNFPLGRVIALSFWVDANMGLALLKRLGAVADDDDDEGCSTPPPIPGLLRFVLGMWPATIQMMQVVIVTVTTPAIAPDANSNKWPQHV